MGLYDHIRGVCPSCNGKLYGQTKYGDPCMNTHWVFEEMEPGDALAVEGERLICDRCPDIHWVEIFPVKFKVKLRKLDVVKLKCDDCGTTERAVEHTFCPYTEEIYKKKESAKLCSRCYDKRVDEI